MPPKFVEGKAAMCGLHIHILVEPLKKLLLILHQSFGALDNFTKMFIFLTIVIYTASV